MVSSHHTGLPLDSFLLHMDYDQVTFLTHPSATLEDTKNKEEEGN